MTTQPSPLGAGRRGVALGVLGLGAYVIGLKAAATISQVEGGSG